MRLKSVTIKGFRGYLGEQTVQLDDLTTLIGKNDVGKSSFLEALEIFFNNDTVKIDAKDCNVDSDDGIIEISCTFSDYPESLILDTQAQTSLAEEYLLDANGNVTLKKVWKTSGRLTPEVFVRAAHPSAPLVSDLLGMTNTALKARFREMSLPPGAANLSKNPSIRRAIWSSVEDLQITDVDISLASNDAKSIWDKLSQHLPLYALFQSDRSSRDSDSEVQDPMKFAVAAAIAEEDVQSKLEAVVEAVRLRATELADRTHGALEKLDPDLARELIPKFKTDPKWASLFSLSLDGERGIPINKRGSGVRRLVLVSFFRAEAERKLADGTKQNIIYAIEEPETSQHPKNQKLLLESLKSLSASEGCQVLLTTHSPGFASNLEVESLRFISRSNEGLPEVLPADEATWERVAEELGVVPDNRVKALICVEGPTDVDGLKSLSRALHDRDPTVIDLTTDQRIAFVVLGGGTLKHWVNKHYLQGLGRPEIHLYDSDVETYAAQIAVVNARTDGSWGVQTSKREVENYLSPDAVQEAFGIEVSFGDQDDVPAIVGEAMGWNPNNTKRKLSQRAFPCMTAERIDAVDANGEIAGWLARILQTVER
ncbi:OLD family endonuclease [Rhodococcus sp. 06-1477-1B]|nr:OLD family endonuclease [Rhodococcus sp. 06-1477-1B]